MTCEVQVPLLCCATQVLCELQWNGAVYATQSCKYGQGRVSYLKVVVDLLQNSLLPGNCFKMMSGTKTFLCKMSKHKRIFLIQSALVQVN